MRVPVRRMARRITWAARSLASGYPLRFDYTKKALLDYSFGILPARPASFADLGGVWGVDGAYTFYVLDTYPVRTAFLADTNFTATVVERSKRYENLTLVEGNFGSPDLPPRIGRVDAVIMFDVLLHQVRPDWDEVLSMYAAVTDCFIIYNQQLVHGETTVRLPDLGVEEYFRHVPMNRNAPGYRNLFEKPEEIHPQHQRPWRDVHNVWQWGITDHDLLACLTQLGFDAVYSKNHGQFSNFESFENHAFVFVRGRG